MSSRAPCFIVLIKIVIVYAIRIIDITLAGFLINEIVKYENTFQKLLKRPIIVIFKIMVSLKVFSVYVERYLYSANSICGICGQPYIVRSNSLYF